MSICDNITVNQETTLKLQSIRKAKTCRNACKKTFNDPKIRRSTAVLLYTELPTYAYAYSIYKREGHLCFSLFLSISHHSILACHFLAFVFCLNCCNLPYCHIFSNLVFFIRHFCISLRYICLFVTFNAVV